MKRRLIHKFVPNGHYCYKYVNGKYKHCKFGTHITIRTKQGDVILSHCRYLNLSSLNCTDEEFKMLKAHYNASDDEIFDKFPLDFLWDGCKECNLNIDNRERAIKGFKKQKNEIFKRRVR